MVSKSCAKARFRCPILEFPDSYMYFVVARLLQNLPSALRVCIGSVRRIQLRELPVGGTHLATSLVGIDKHSNTF